MRIVDRCKCLSKRHDNYLLMYPSILDSLPHYKVFIIYKNSSNTTFASSTSCLNILLTCIICPAPFVPTSPYLPNDQVVLECVCQEQPVLSLFISCWSFSFTLSTPHSPTTLRNSTLLTLTFLFLNVSVLLSLVRKMFQSLT